VAGRRGLKATKNLLPYAFVSWRLVAENNSCIDYTNNVIRKHTTKLDTHK